MDEGLAEAREPRDRFYWRLTNAQVLKEAGLGALATQQLQTCICRFRSWRSMSGSQL